MSWRLEFQRGAEHDLSTLDSELRHRIIDKLDWLVKNFDETTHLPLGGPWKGFFKLRVGDWRVICEEKHSKKLIIVHYIDLRDKICKLKK